MSERLKEIESQIASRSESWPLSFRDALTVIAEPKRINWSVLQLIGRRLLLDSGIETDELPQNRGTGTKKAFRPEHLVRLEILTRNLSELELRAGFARRVVRNKAQEILMREGLDLPI